MEPTGGAFERLCEEEWPTVMRTAYLITGDRSEAEDLAQEAFVRAYERWSTVAALDRPQAWLQRVVVNLSLSWRRDSPFDAVPYPSVPPRRSRYRWTRTSSRRSEHSLRPCAL